MSKERPQEPIDPERQYWFDRYCGAGPMVNHTDRIKSEPKNQGHGK